MTAKRTAPAATEPAHSSPSSPLASPDAGSTAITHGCRPPSFGETLRQIREQCGMTRPELAERAGLNPSTVWSIESGRRQTELPTIRRIAAALGATDRERDQLLVAAGYLPVNPAYSINDPDLADLADILADPDLSAYWASIRELMRTIVTLYGVTEEDIDDDTVET